MKEERDSFDRIIGRYAIVYDRVMAFAKPYALIGTAFSLQSVLLVVFLRVAELKVEPAWVLPVAMMGELLLWWYWFNYLLGEAAKELKTRMKPTQKTSKAWQKWVGSAAVIVVLIIWKLSPWEK